MISNPKSHTVKAFTMYDAAGKLIFNNVNLGNNTEYTFPTRFFKLWSLYRKSYYRSKH